MIPNSTRIKRVMQQAQVTVTVKIGEVEAEFEVDGKAAYRIAIEDEDIPLWQVMQQLAYLKVHGRLQPRGASEPAITDPDMGMRIRGGQFGRL